jgi:hypothetical protein
MFDGAKRFVLSLPTMLSPVQRGVVVQHSPPNTGQRSVNTYGGISAKSHALTNKFTQQLRCKVLNAEVLALGLAQLCQLHGQRAEFSQFIGIHRARPFFASITKTPNPSLKLTRYGS